ncbi:MAG: response regulator [Sphingobacteriaceae bacterium]|nr:MAG: response regulator [Sphingobacteriaceae bacterium]
MPSKKIIIFDDDDDILSICTYILEDQGWQVHTFDNCSNVIEKVDGIKPDVILMDNWIPDTGGILATQQLKLHSTLKTIPVVYFSANSDIQSLANTAGAESYIAKPFDLTDLERVIHAAIQSTINSTPAA